ncbi:MAG: NAD-binding protein, partial [Anaerolineaceae bacterium]|nr:NAD-binding protein [Anaerolineaceae bacterium]
WFLLGGIWLFGLALGYSGFAKFLAASGENTSFLSVVYLTLQLITIESGSITQPIGLELEIARFLLPALVAYTTFSALASLFREQVQHKGLLFTRGHVVVCGLSSKGFLLARSFFDRGDKVVVIEQNVENDFVKQCKDKGIIVMIGDAADMRLLDRAMIHKAAHLFAVCDDDGTNTEIAINARKSLEGRRRDPLNCFIHIENPQLWELLREQELTTDDRSMFRLTLDNVFERGAQLMLQEGSKMRAKDQPAEHLSHLLIVGLGKLGENLLVNAARFWMKITPSDDQKLKITAVDLEAEEKVDSLRARYPRLDSVCEIKSHSIRVQSSQFQKAGFLFNEQNDFDIDEIYVCFDRNSLSLYTALVLLGHTKQYNIPIIVRMTEDVGLAALLRADVKNDTSFRNLHAFGLLTRTCTPDLLLGGSHEVLAQAIHEEYVRKGRERGAAGETDESMLAWNDLSERLKEANRRQADRIGAKLKAVKCEISLLSDWDAPLFEFTEEEIEMLA